ncbi:autotransporter assembly complex protein TamA [Sphingosinicella soli]|uniref:Translocation and assembly module TamA n=1 Tax=Sphingosinicella soli TaxID=333708 RepID=A0A7W7F7E4_9SPHN|nr:BamA/TamA family outer membrane protein [Sphingosinicella soli]MBB4633575.1 translocation and assembly module TamA [Sphingosinicella soli]
MYRALIGTSFTAIALILSSPGAAQQPAAPAQDSDTPDQTRLDEQRTSPRVPLPELPEIEDEWKDLFAEDAAEDDVALDAQDAPVDLRYEFELGPISRLKSADAFKSLSALYAERGKVVPSLAELQRRARTDSELLARLLRAEGYYDPEIVIEVDPTARDGLLLVTATVDTGPRYALGDIQITVDNEADRALVEQKLALEEKQPLVADDINGAFDRLRLGLGESGFPFADVENPDIVVDHDTRTASYALNVKLGDNSRFGQIQVDGDPLFSAKHLGRLARFKPGDVYDTREIEDLRRALIATGLVSTASITPRRGEAQADGTVPVDLIVTLTPAPQRTLAGQLGYSTTDGFRIEASWQHRNLVRPQGQVTFRGVLGTEEQRLSADLRRSNWKQRDRTLAARVEASVEDRDAYYARTLGLGAFIERETNLIWQKAWTYRFGAELQASEERDRSLKIAPGFAPLRTFIIAAAPVQIAYDGTDDLLDPKRGFRLGGWASPEASFQDGFFGYTRAQIDGSAYLPMMDDNLIFAGRARIGTIFGATRARIAPSRRFYSGGGGSVRGYGYQDVGPQDDEGDPLGGRSLMEFSLEARYRFGNIGVVPFIDAGQIDTRPYPRFRDLQFGAGIGVRYYTNFGPVRIDVATPLNRQQGDSRVAVYVSIGQAF